MDTSELVDLGADTSRDGIATPLTQDVGDPLVAVGALVLVRFVGVGDRCVVVAAAIEERIGVNVQVRAPWLGVLAAREADYVAIDGEVPMGRVTAADADPRRPARFGDVAGATESPEDMVCMFWIGCRQCSWSLCSRVERRDTPVIVAEAPLSTMERRSSPAGCRWRPERVPEPARRRPRGA